MQLPSRVPFPAFTGERVYMRRFERGEPLPVDLRRWQSTVDVMLDGVDSAGPVYLMIDQSAVKSGAPHRRPGIHVDNYWHEGTSQHDQGHGNRPTMGCHGVPVPSPPTHNPRPSHSIYGSGEALIIASDVLGCVGYVGMWSGEQRENGDCCDVDVSSLERVPFEPGRAWLGDTATLLHESIPLAADALRTVVRLNVKGWGSATR
jgi:hypothetical protein